MTLASLTQLLLIVSTSLGQPLPRQYVQRQMNRLFEVAQDTTDGRTYRYERVVQLPPTNAFADLTKHNEQYLFYIKENYATINYSKLRSTSADLNQATKRLIKAFERDSLYTRWTTELAYYYLQAKGIGVVGYQPPPKQQVSTAELMRIASRFFYAHSVDRAPDSIGFHVCVGMNGFHHNPQLLTNPLVEAFCFMALFQNLHNPEHTYWTYFTQQVKRLRTKYRLGTDPVQRVEAARQEMYSLMATNADLRRALIKEYVHKARMLNFVLID